VLCLYLGHSRASVRLIADFAKNHGFIRFEIADRHADQCISSRSIFFTIGVAWFQLDSVGSLNFHRCH